MTEPQETLAAWIGRTMEAEDIVTPRLDTSFRATFGPNLAVTEEGVASPGLHWCLSPEIADTSRLGSEGHLPGGDFRPPVPLPRRMWAGSEVQILAPLRIGDHVRRRSTIDGITWKQGKTGTLCFVSICHDIANAKGSAISELQTLVYREAKSIEPAPIAKASGTTHIANDRARRVLIDEVLLFRYSALTFNGHRIHYDIPYATNVEGYAGLVVHGLLQATLLLNHAARAYGREPSHFTFRSLSAAVGAQTLTLIAAKVAANMLDLRIEAASGAVSMQATATWQ